MSDPIGTIRREDHHDDGGYSIWVRVEADRRRDERPWLCVHSTAWGNVGERLALVGDAVYVGAIPFSLASLEERPTRREQVLLEQGHAKEMALIEELRSARELFQAQLAKTEALQARMDALSVSVTEEKR